MTTRFTLLDELGRGGMGVVWRSRDEETGLTVALKFLASQHVADPAYVERFGREVELARLVGSPHVVRVLGYGTREGLPFLVMEYVDGSTLRERIRASGALTWPVARELLIGITDGLVAIHAAGIIHRDVKPSNVLLTRLGSPKLADFGIAKAAYLFGHTPTPGVLGTPAYLPPEGTRDERSDLYSLGALAFEILVGVPPFEGLTPREILDAHRREAPRLEQLPLEARGFVGSLLEKNPARRPQSAAAVLAELIGPAVPSPARSGAGFVGVVDRGQLLPDVPVPAGVAVVIGRAPEAAIRVSDPIVSRRHATLLVEDGGWTVTDLRSTNPTRVLGPDGTERPLRGTVRLAAGQLLVGGSIFTLHAIGDKS